MACVKSNISLTELALRFGSNPSPFSIRLQHGKFTKKELEDIAKILKCKYRSYFKFADGSVIESSDICTQIKNALAYNNMSVSELADKFGIQIQSMYKKMQIGKFTQDDLCEIAKYIGCEYISEFCYEDGIAI